MQAAGEVEEVAIDLPAVAIIGVGTPGSLGSRAAETTNEPSGSKIIRGNASSNVAASSHVQANDASLGSANRLTWKWYMRIVYAA